jgi:hypothetical protein
VTVELRRRDERRETMNQREPDYRRETARQYFRVVCMGRRDWTPVVKGASHYHEVRCGEFNRPEVAWLHCWALEKRFPGYRFSVFSCDPITG